MPTRCPLFPDPWVAHHKHTLLLHRARHYSRAQWVLCHRPRLHPPPRSMPSSSYRAPKTEMPSAPEHPRSEPSRGGMAALAGLELLEAARVAILKSASLASGDRNEHLQQALNSLGYSWSTSEVSSCIAGSGGRQGARHALDAEGPLGRRREPCERTTACIVACRAID